DQLLASTLYSIGGPQREGTGRGYTRSDCKPGAYPPGFAVPFSWERKGRNRMQPKRHRECQPATVDAHSRQGGRASSCVTTQTTHRDESILFAPELFLQ